LLYLQLLVSLRNKTILDKIGALIPGYNGYATRSDKRKTDRIFREQHSILINESESFVVEYQKILLFNNDIQLLKEWESVRKKLNTLISLLKFNNYGESSFFSEDQIKDEELNKIMDFDEQVSERVQFIFKTTQTEIDQVSSIKFTLNWIEEIENILLNRSTFISNFK
jgi:hypothetical protein